MIDFNLDETLSFLLISENPKFFHCVLVKRNKVRWKVFIVNLFFVFSQAFESTVSLNPSIIKTLTASMFYLLYVYLKR